MFSVLLGQASNSLENGANPGSTPGRGMSLFGIFWGTTPNKRRTTHTKWIMLYKAMKIDPYKHKERYLSWKASNNQRIASISKENSDIILRYIEDMERGLNVALGSPKGGRSYHRVNYCGLKPAASRVNSQQASSATVQQLLVQ